MAVTIQLPAEIEQAVRNRAEVAGVNLETYLAVVVAEDLPRQRMSPLEFRERLDQIIGRLPTSGHFIDDSRESIYAGRGE